jgi:hypothetical protein
MRRDDGFHVSNDLDASLSTSRPWSAPVRDILAEQRSWLGEASALDRALRSMVRECPVPARLVRLILDLDEQPPPLAH